MWVTRFWQPHRSCKMTGVWSWGKEGNLFSQRYGMALLVFANDKVFEKETGYEIHNKVGWLIGTHFISCLPYLYSWWELIYTSTKCLLPPTFQHLCVRVCVWLVLVHAWWVQAILTSLFQVLINFNTLRIILFCFFYIYFFYRIFLSIR